MTADAKSPKAIGKRLELTRHALGYVGRGGQTEFLANLASTMPVTIHRWNAHERGRQRISIKVATALCERFNLSLDWIYRGMKGSLPQHLASKIDQLETAQSAPKSAGEDQHLLDEIGKRLKLLRSVLGYTDVDMGNIAWVSDKPWQDYEAGIQRITTGAITKLKRATGVTKEWIYEGDIAQVPFELAGKLQREQASKVESSEGAK